MSKTEAVLSPIEQLTEDAKQAYLSGKIQPRQGGYFYDDTQCCGLAAAVCFRLGAYTYNDVHAIDSVSDNLINFYPDVSNTQIGSFFRGFDHIPNSMGGDEVAYKLGWDLWESVKHLEVK